MPLKLQIRVFHLGVLKPCTGIFAGVSSNGWDISDLYLTRKCSVTTLRPFFAGQKERIKSFASAFNTVTADSDIDNALFRLSEKCSAFNPVASTGSAIQQFNAHLDKSIRDYQQCLEEKHAPLVSVDLSPHPAGHDPKYATLGATASDVWSPDVFENQTGAEEAISQRISFDCLVAAVGDSITPGFTVTIEVKRYTKEDSFLLPVVLQAFCSHKHSAAQFVGHISSL